MLCAVKFAYQEFKVLWRV